MEYIYLQEVTSTNTWMLDQLANGHELAEQTVAYTTCQTAGRGQMGNGWESEPHRNIAYSMLLKPEFVPITRQFVISELCCLGIVEALERLQEEQGMDCQLCIKWPNDIYAGDRKLAGILIENRLMGTKLTHSVLGVGINVNQERWIGNAPNPVSLKMMGIVSTPEDVLKRVTEQTCLWYERLRDNEAEAGVIHERFMQRLYRREGLHAYYDPQTREHFEARVAGVDPQGPIRLQLRNGEERRYWFKEVQFVLPCGVTKE